MSARTAETCGGADRRRLQADLVDPGAAGLGDGHRRAVGGRRCADESRCRRARPQRPARSTRRGWRRRRPRCLARRDRDGADQPAPHFVWSRWWRDAPMLLLRTRDCWRAAVVSSTKKSLSPKKAEKPSTVWSMVRLPPAASALKPIDASWRVAPGCWSPDRAEPEFARRRSPRSSGGRRRSTRCHRRPASR